MYLIFNSKKSLAIKYGKEVNDTEYVLLGQNRINWVDSVKHLGNYFNTQLSDSTDCMMKRSTFIGSVFIDKIKHLAKTAYGQHIIQCYYFLLYRKIYSRKQIYKNFLTKTIYNYIHVINKKNNV